VRKDDLNYFFEQIARFRFHAGVTEGCSPTILPFVMICLLRVMALSLNIDNLTMNRKQTPPSNKAYTNEQGK
jgi:hypothetical protein